MKLSRFLFKRTCFFVLFIFCGLISAHSPDTHTYADTVELDTTSADFRGNVRLLQTQLQIFAHRLRLKNLSTGAEQEFVIEGAENSPLLIRSPHWELVAVQARLLKGLGVIRATQAHLFSQQPHFDLKAQSLFLSDSRWSFDQVEVRLPGVPGTLWSTHVDYLPATNTLWLQGVTYQPFKGGPQVSWPDIQWRFDQNNEEVLRLRPETARFQPQLRLDNGFDLGVSSELWKTPQQSAFAGLFYGEQTGWRTQGALEWRFTPRSTLLAQGSLQQNTILAETFAGAADYFHQTDFEYEGFSTQVFGQVGVSFQQRNNFLQQFGLPLQQSKLNYSGLQTLFTIMPQKAFSERLNTLLMIGGQWGSESRFNALWQGEWEAFEGAGHRLLASSQAHVLFEKDFRPTLALRLTDIWQMAPSLSVGGYLEQYISSLPADRFLSEQRLAPWLGGFFRWQLTHTIGLAADLAVAPIQGDWTRANALLTWRYEGFYFHLGGFLVNDSTMSAGFSGGPQLSVQFALPDS